MDILKPTNQEIEVTSKEHLGVTLEMYGVTEHKGWGKKFLGSKSFDDLYDELQDGFCRLAVVESKLIRVRSLAAINILVQPEVRSPERDKLVMYLDVRGSMTTVDDYRFFPKAPYSWYQPINLNSLETEQQDEVIDETRQIALAHTIGNISTNNRPPAPIEESYVEPLIISNSQFYPGLPIRANVLVQDITIDRSERDCFATPRRDFVEKKAVILDWERVNNN